MVTGKLSQGLLNVISVSLKFLCFHSLSGMAIRIISKPRKNYWQTKQKLVI
jgi:hypothetical protein